MANSEEDELRVRALKRALEMVTAAVDLLDAHRGPPDAAAHLAMAQQNLLKELAKSS